MSVPRIEHASLTDVGVRRSHNQDAFAVHLANSPDAWKERGHLYLVADGMGAHAVGELASKMAADVIPHMYQKHADEGAVEALQRAFIMTNAAIRERAEHNPEFAGMGTTGTALLLRPEGAWIAHVGDSRAYRIREGHIDQITYDHSLQWELAKRHGLEPHQIEGVPSNVIVRSLGPDAVVKVDIEGPHPLQPGDVFLLCSDGLSGQLSDQEMGAVVTALPADEACQFLVDLANLRGGPDNSTVILVHIMEDDPEIIALADANSKPKSWRDQYSLSGTALTSGVVFAILSLVAVVIRLPTLVQLIAFAFSFVSLVVGLVSVRFEYQKERKLSRQAEARPPRIYRQTLCDLDRPLVESLAKGVEKIQGILNDKHLEFDAGELKGFREAAEAAMMKDDLETAFKNYCRAMGTLTASLRQQRNKEEIFQPIWDAAE